MKWQKWLGVGSCLLCVVWCTVYLGQTRKIIHWWHLNVPEISASKTIPPLINSTVINEHNKQCQPQTHTLTHTHQTVHHYLYLQQYEEKKRHNYERFDVAPEMLQFSSAAINKNHRYIWILGVSAAGEHCALCNDYLKMSGWIWKVEFENASAELNLT